MPRTITRPKVWSKMRTTAKRSISKAFLCQDSRVSVLFTIRTAKKPRPRRARRLRTARAAYQIKSSGTFIQPKSAQKLAKVSRKDRAMEDGGWRMEGREWRMKDGEWEVNAQRPSPMMVTIRNKIYRCLDFALR